MSIPLVIFLFAWFVFLVIFTFLALVSVVQMLRFGVAGPGTYLSTVTFLAVTGLVLGGVGLYLAGVDWNATLDIALTPLL
ncbi:hypothetical protein KJ781_00175 [Patescibacteria group bacterium]|nr:hypothetical protein [Patescibacteria group bacterium]MBU1448768.1 hypothetical protein [Patescibacteria group bacterium]MBU2613400.1 hypothetical protein [Patescibacteria group bacterium]